LTLGQRVREIREEQFGEHGVRLVARAIGLPPQTWLNYEDGVTMPATVLLQFIERTGADPRWLLSGRGRKYREGGLALHPARVGGPASPLCN